jgi:type I restriction enzyme S subunit
MSSEWRQTTLGRVATLKRGFDLPHRKRTRGDVPVVTSSGFGDTHGAAAVNGPGVVTGRYGTIGEVFYVEEDFWPLNTTLYVRDFHGNDPLFVSYLLRTVDFQSHSGKSGVPGVNRNDIHELAVQVPSPDEQRRIASALSDIDVLLTKVDHLIAKKRDVKRAVMQQLLSGRSRLPSFQDLWRGATIGDIADVKTGPFGSSLHESDYVEAGTPIITVEHLGERSITRQNLPLVSDEDCRRLRAYSLEAGDVVFSRVGSIDRNALVTVAESGWLFSGRLLRVRVKRDRADPAFLSHQFHSEAFKQRVRELAVGQTMPSLNTQILRRLPVALPSLAEQRAIAKVLFDMDAELTALEARRDKTRQLKQGMMQALLTGRIRLT